ncbi:MAG: tyrosine-type recombinase/integrase [Pseudonocardiaceae bacterium]
MTAQQPQEDNLIRFPGPTDQPVSATGGGLEQVPEVLDGELVSEAEYARRPMPVVLPPWLRSRETALSTLWWALEYAGRHVAFHALRAPAYGLALAWWTLRGVARVLAAGAGWVSVRGEYRPLITAAREAKRWDLVRDLITERRALARVRMKTTAWLTVSGGSAGAAGFLLVGPMFGWCAATGAGLGALWIGRPSAAPVLPPGPVLPVQLELSADMLTDALRAAGLVKADATLQLVTPPLRDGNGWAVTLDLPRGGGKTAADVIAKRDTVAAELGVDEIQVIMSRVRAAAGGHAGRLTVWVADDDPYLGDKRSVINPIQARSLLRAVHEARRSGPRLVAFFGLMYFSALRPEEAANVRSHNLALPSEGWGELHIDEATPYAGTAWTNDGKQRDRRQLKNRARGESRTVPCPPELTAMLHGHIRDFGTGAGGGLFPGERADELPKLTYMRVWRAARLATFSKEVQASPLARTPYDLRHACVSTWLNGGVPATQVAEWAGHSVEVLLKVYAKCLDGHEEVARRRVQEALGYGPT